MPDWRVVVDTKKPGLGLESVSRRGPVATVRWDARDEYLDLGTLVIEYSMPDTGEWKRVVMNRPATSGETSWDTGTSEAIRVRATVADKAGNVQHAETELGDGAAQRPTLTGSRPESMEAGAPAPIAHMASARNSRGILGPHQDAQPKSKTPQGDWVETPTPSSVNGPAAQGTAARNRYAGGGSGNSGQEPRRPDPIASSGRPLDHQQVPLIASPKFPLNYSVDDAGPNGPALVELWVTRDGGKNWSRWSEDADRKSPMDVDLGGEGVYGLSIVARSLAGQGDEVPRSGTAPQMMVEVDSTPPSMILNVIKVGVGSQSGKVLISWQADDRNFGPKPISIYYRPETGTKWLPVVEGVENTGQFVWTPGPQVPPVFHVRVEGKDDAGNRAGVDTLDYEPVLLDRSRPKARILGLNGAPGRETREAESAPAARIHEFSQPAEPETKREAAVDQRPPAVESAAAHAPAVTAPEVPPPVKPPAEPVAKPVVKEPAKSPVSVKQENSQPRPEAAAPAVAPPGLKPPVEEKPKAAPGTVGQTDAAAAALASSKSSEPATAPPLGTEPPAAARPLDPAPPLFDIPTPGPAAEAPPRLNESKTP